MQTANIKHKVECMFARMADAAMVLWGPLEVI